VWTKQHQAFCRVCGRTTNHFTHYLKDEEGGGIVPDEHCAEHREDLAAEQPQT